MFQLFPVMCQCLGTVGKSGFCWKKELYQVIPKKNWDHTKPRCLGEFPLSLHWPYRGTGFPLKCSNSCLSAVNKSLCLSCQSPSAKTLQVSSLLSKATLVIIFIAIISPHLYIFLTIINAVSWELQLGWAAPPWQLKAGLTLPSESSPFASSSLVPSLWGLSERAQNAHPPSLMLSLILAKHCPSDPLFSCTEQGLSRTANRPLP